MTKSTITRERLQELAAGQSGLNLRTATHEESQELARMALAAMDSEPMFYVDGEAAKRLLRGHTRFATMTTEPKPGKTLPLYIGPQRAPVVPEECPAEIRDLMASHSDALFNDDDAQEIWNACRAAMLQAEPVCTCPSGNGSLRWPCPVHPGNYPVIPDSARDALEKALAAMEFMGDTLNNLDAVCTEDVELVAPAFDAVRSVLAAALQEGK